MWFGFIASHTSIDAVLTGEKTSLHHKTFLAISLFLVQYSISGSQLFFFSFRGRKWFSSGGMPFRIHSKPSKCLCLLGFSFSKRFAHITGPTTTTTTTRKLQFTPDSKENYNCQCYTKARMKRPPSILEIITYMSNIVCNFLLYRLFSAGLFAFSWGPDRHYCFRRMHAIYHPFMNHLTCWKTRHTE